VLKQYMLFKEIHVTGDFKLQCVWSL